jgi:TolB protein
MRKVILVLGIVSALACGTEPDSRNDGGDQSRAKTGGGPASLPSAVVPFPGGLKGTLVFESDRDGRPKIYTLDLSNGKVAPLTESGDWRDESPKWSPDGKRIAFASTRQGSNFDIFIMNADGSGVERLTDNPAIEHDPVWDPDGRSIIFSGERDGRGELYRVWLESRRVVRLTDGINRAIMPAVSPDGKSVSWAGQTIRYFQIHVRGVSDFRSDSVQLTSGEPACRPAWSPDGQQITYVLGEDPSRLGILSIATKESRTLFKHPKLWLYYPAFSRDAQHVAFSVSPEHHRGEDWDLALISAAAPDTSFQRLTVGPGNDRLPDWKP